MRQVQGPRATRLRRNQEVVGTRFVNTSTVNTGFVDVQTSAATQVREVLEPGQSVNIEFPVAAHSRYIQPVVDDEEPPPPKRR